MAWEKRGYERYEDLITHLISAIWHIGYTISEDLYHG